jgi:hypothetical protein
MLEGIGVGVMTVNVVLNRFIAHSSVLDGERRAPMTLVLGEGTDAGMFYCLQNPQRQTRYSRLPMRRNWGRFECTNMNKAHTEVERCS